MEDALRECYVAKYDSDMYQEIIDKLQEIGCINAMDE